MLDEKDQKAKKWVLATISDAILDFLYYDRKEDYNLPVGEIESLVKNGVITVDEICEAFTEELKKGLG